MIDDLEQNGVGGVNRGRADQNIFVERVGLPSSDVPWVSVAGDKEGNVPG